MKKVAIILSGAGYLDGAEIRESVLTLLALDTEGAEYDIFSFNEDQYHVVNHLTGAVTDQKRNVMEEAARIARGKVSDIAELNVSAYDALMMPGGFGVAKNLSTFAFEGSAGGVNPKLLEVVKAFHEAQKPIAAICISPVVIGLALGEHSPNVTLGKESDFSMELEKTGAKHQVCSTSEYVFDEKNKILSTPAYMDDSSSLAVIYTGISKVVKKTLSIS
jgi:enhancing lycopene biosynthesis protein 2